MCRPSQSPHLTMLHSDRPAEADLGFPKRGAVLLSDYFEQVKITLKVVGISLFAVSSLTLIFTPLKSFHKVGLESSSTGWSFSSPGLPAKPPGLIWLSPRFQLVEWV
ncbi:hypothetical protein HKD37_U059171 [Glycine soja]